MTIAVRQAVVADAQFVATLNRNVPAVHLAALPNDSKALGPESFSESEVRASLAKSA